MSEPILEIVDDDFLAQVDAAEASALSNSAKRRKIATTTTTTTANSSLATADEGVYTAVLRGSRSPLFQHQYSKPKVASTSLTNSSREYGSGTNNAFVNAESANTNGGGGGGGGGDSCFKCGKSGHWARDCDATSHTVDPSMPEKACPCGLGACLVLTAKTDKNCGRKFYKCPFREENGGCGFFEWCDKSSGSDNVTIRSQSYLSNPSSFPELSCPCGAGSCLILTAKTGKNIGQQFYRCPASQGSCGFFKWCSDHTTKTGFSDSVNTSDVRSNVHEMSNKNYATSGSSCFKCGKDGHWAKDCPQSSFQHPSDLGGKCASWGTCYKCGKPGHGAKDCSSSANTRTRLGQ